MVTVLMGYMDYSSFTLKKGLFNFTHTQTFQRWLFLLLKIKKSHQLSYPVMGLVCYNTDLPGKIWIPMQEEHDCYGNNQQLSALSSGLFYKRYLMSGTTVLVKSPWLEKSQIMVSESTTVSWLNGQVVFIATNKFNS